MDDLTPAVAAPSAMEEFRRTWNLVPGHFMQYQCHERHARELDELRKRVAEGQGEVALRCAEIARTACAMLRSDYSAYRQPLEARILHVIHETAGMRAAEAIRAYATTLPADEGSVRMPIAFIEELLNDQYSDFRKSFGDKLRAMLAAAKGRT